MIRVKATREGLVGKRTASGYVLDYAVAACALPSSHALFKPVFIRNTLNGLWTLALCLDVGPWNVGDDAYVFGHARPQAERGIDLQGRKTNGAGIDLSEKTWFELRMADNGVVEWQFIGLDDIKLSPLVP